MRAPDPVLDIVSDAQLREFVAFMRSQQGTKSLPDFQAINLMDVPRLLPLMFVIDFTNGIRNGILIHFSGRMIDEYFGCNIQGRMLEDVYDGQDGLKFVQAIYRRCYANADICIRIKNSVYEHRIYGRTNGIQSFMLWPCSSDGTTVDFAVGYASVNKASDPVADVLEFVATR